MERAEAISDIGDRFNTISLRISCAPDASSKQTAIQAFFELCDTLLASRPELAMLVFQEMAFLHAEVHPNSVVWDQIVRWAKSEDARIRFGLEVGFLCDVPEPPIILRDLERLWKLGTAPETRWTVHAAYRGQSKRFSVHRQRLRKWLEKHGVDVCAVTSAFWCGR